MPRCYRNVFEHFLLWILPDYEFAAVFLSTPIRAGKDTVLNFLQGAKEHLNEDGSLWFVIRKDQGALSIKKILESVNTVELINRDKGYYVFRIKKNN